MSKQGMVKYSETSNRKWTCPPQVLNGQKKKAHYQSPERPVLLRRNHLMGPVVLGNQVQNREDIRKKYPNFSLHTLYPKQLEASPQRSPRAGDPARLSFQYREHGREEQRIDLEAGCRWTIRSAYIVKPEQKGQKWELRLSLIEAVIQKTDWVSPQYLLFVFPIRRTGIVDTSSR